MYRPIVQLPLSKHSLPTNYSFQSLEQLAEIQWLLIPSLKITGIEAKQPSLRQDFMDKSHRLNLHRLSFRINRQSDQSQQVSFASSAQVVEIQGSVSINIDLEHNDKNEFIKALPQIINQAKLKTRLMVQNREGLMVNTTADESLSRYLSQKRTLKCVFKIGSKSKLNSPKNKSLSSFTRQIPVKYLMHISDLCVPSVIQVFAQELASALKVMLRNDLTHRSVYRKNGLLLNSYSKNLESEATIDSQTGNIIKTQVQASTIQSEGQDQMSFGSVTKICAGVGVLVLLYVLIRYYWMSDFVLMRPFHPRH